MSNPFAVAKRYLVESPRAAPEVVPEVVEDGTIQGVRICSHVLQDEIWLILDRSFVPPDGLVCYYADEIPLLKDKTPEELRQIHMVKLEFRGSRVVQGGSK